MGVHNATAMQALFIDNISEVCKSSLETELAHALT